MNSVIEKVFLPVLVTLVGAMLLSLFPGVRRVLRSRRATIWLRNMPRMPDERVRLMLRQVRDGKDNVDGRGPIRNANRAFCRGRAAGEWRARTRMDPTLGFQFKCYVDFTLSIKSKVLGFLKECGVTAVDEDESLEGTRLWFLLPGQPRCTTVDGYTNNYFHAGSREVVHDAEQAN